jgi:transposase-like protein
VGAQYPAIIRLWENAWSEFVPFLDYDVEIRRVFCSTNAESLNARYCRAIRARGHFRTSCPEVSLPRHPITGSDRAG